MYDYVEGILERKSPAEAVIGAGGVGYAVKIPLSTFRRLPGEGERARLLVRLHVREDAHILYGFLTHDERQLFESLISVGGVGPSIALMLLSSSDAATVAGAIARQDVAFLSSIKGIGEKTAKRIALELKDKVVYIAAGAAARPPAAAKDAADAVLALVSLGYTRPAAQEAVEKVLGVSKASPGTEEIVRKALLQSGKATRG